MEAALTHGRNDDDDDMLKRVQLVVIDTKRKMMLNLLTQMAIAILHWNYIHRVEYLHGMHSPTGSVAVAVRYCIWCGSSGRPPQRGHSNDKCH